MKKRVYLSLVVVALLCVVGWTAHAQLQKSISARQAWEYKAILISNFEAPGNWFEDGRQLAGVANMQTKSKELGDQGWELVSVTPMSSMTSIGGEGTIGGVTTGMIFWFKRPK